MHLLAGYCSDVKPIRDPIYGFISVPKEFIPILDNEFVQRLRWVSQLPLEQLVYPSSMHSRFEHSLGCMYLAMFAALSLIRDAELASDSKLKAAFKEGECKFDNKNKKDFIFAAGIAALLHDLGHAPFSHTLEDVKNYIDQNEFYDHEKVTIDIAKRILYTNDLSQSLSVPKSLAFDALNKDLDDTATPPLSIIIRKLIDSKAIDVDRGDYLLRDSYHCGVTYGLYDYRRLWGNLTIDNNYNIAVTEKSALEAWSLMFARHKMFTNVYKHHVRDLSDALLIDAIRGVYSKKPEIIPVKNNKLENIDEFLFWTDDNFLKNLHDSDSDAKSKIQDFKKRKLYKHCEDIPLLNIDAKILNKKLDEARNQLFSKNFKTIFINTACTVIPMQTSSVDELFVRKDDGDFTTLSTYLELPQVDNVEEAAEKHHNKKLSAKPILRIYTERAGMDQKALILDTYKKAIEQIKLF